MSWWIFLIITAILGVAELVYFKVADKFNIIDKPNLRSSHTHITLRGGGIIFLFGAWLWVAFFGLQYSWFMIGLTAIFQELGLLQWDMWWAVLIALIVCVGITNAYNFMDGINGITGAYSLSVLFPLIYINAHTPFVNMPFLVVTGLAILVFSFFNFRKQARCFAGDVGAVGIAFILIFSVGKLIVKENDLSYIVFFTVYGVDTVLTICHRILLHENLGEAHRKHAYQIMANELGLSHPLVSTIYMLMQLLISFGMIMLPINHWIYMCGVFVIFGCAYLLFMKKYYHLHVSYLERNNTK